MINKNGIIPFKVTHSRFLPKKYSFTHNFFWFKLSLDNDSFTSPFVKRNKFSLYSFFDRDHLKLGHKDVRDNYIQFLKNNGVDESIKSVIIYTQLRFLGYVFNPVSFIIAENDIGEKYAIIEICNTFNELKAFFVSKDKFENNNFIFETNKYFYISPFIKHDAKMSFRFKTTSDGTISLNIDDFEDNSKVLSVSFIGKEVTYNNFGILKSTLRSPFITIQFIILIHIHAFVLWIKRIKFYKKNELKHLQKGAQVWKTSKCTKK